MPIAQFPGTRNWGYDGVHLYAPQNSYGGPRGLQQLVDACHAAGMAIFLDVVYNHLGPEGNYLHDFGPYFTHRYSTPWGQAVNYDSFGSDTVRDFVLHNAQMWLEEYHVDGLRLDAVHAICDLRPQNILRAIKEVADGVSRRTSREIHIVAESDLNDPRLLHGPERGGFGLDAQWSDDFHHAVHAYLTGESQGYYSDFGQAVQLPRVLESPYLYAGEYSPHRGRTHGSSPAGLTGDRFVVAIQNHDQVGNRARGDRLSALLSPPAQRLAASLMLLAPYLPLLFMGEEYGEERPFQYFCSFTDEQLVDNVRQGRRREFADFAWSGEVPDPQSEATFSHCRLTWSWPAGSRQAGLRNLYADLLAGRRHWPPLRDLTHRSASLLPDPEEGPFLRLIRGGTAPQSGVTAEIFFNLSARRHSCGQKPTPGYRVLLSSEAAKYGGQRHLGDQAIVELLPYECLVFGAGSWPSFGL
jgi:maltooligosyltrehalose trehalohydrolase